MFRNSSFIFLLIITTPLFCGEDAEVSRLISAMLGETQMISNLRSLTDEIGGRPTGGKANLAAVEWALQRFQKAGVPARREAFAMPDLWLENSVEARIHGDIQFIPAMAAMPYSAALPGDGLTASIVDGGYGTEEDLRKAGDALRNSFVLIKTHELNTLDDLFREYGAGPGIEARVKAAGAAGMVYMGSRPKNLLYRHNVAQGSQNKLPMLIMEREAAMRTSRLLEQGRDLKLTAKINLETGGEYTSYNVIGEIKGSQKPDEIVVIGAHLDSWDLGTGALDNGCNVALVMEIAAQMVKLGIKPARTIRFCLWNGEEQGFYGSFGYTKTHKEELDKHVMALSVDIGSGRINGFFVSGPQPMEQAVNQVLKPVAGLGPFTQIAAPIVGTDNYDFMMQGIGNLVANQESANYGPHYHARSDTFDKVDQNQLRLNSAVIAALALGFAELDFTWERLTRAELEQLMTATDLEHQMKGFAVWEAWENGSRGRTD